MKRGIITLALLILLFTPLILAEDTITEPAKEQLSALRGGLDIETENILERQITLPEILEGPLSIILGIEEDATWQQLIIVLGVFIGFFALVLSIAGFIPFFKEGWIRALASLVITSLVSITGALDSIAKFFFNIAGFFEWTASWGPLRMIIAIIIAVIIIIAFNKVSNILKHKMKIEKAEETAKNINLTKKVGEIQKEILES
jgi:hypothetical protein